MPAPIEREIGAHLAKSRDPAETAAEFARRWNSHLLSEEEQADVALFLVRAGQISVFFDSCLRMLADGRRLPWSALAEAFWIADVSPSPREALAIEIGVDEQNAWPDLLASARTAEWGEAFAKRRSELNSRRALELEERRAQLWDAIRFMRLNRLFEQEAKALEELRAQFPDDPEFAEHNESLQERWAREILAQSRGARAEREPSEDAEDELNEAELEMRRSIARQAAERAKARPERGVDFALLLYFMDFRNEAIELLDSLNAADPASSTEPRPSRDWLRLELLLLARQFVTALEECSRLEAIYACQPDAAFAVAYARARALWGLGEKEMALELARSIVRARPGYRSAQSLAMQWSAEAAGGRGGGAGGY